MRVCGKAYSCLLCTVVLLVFAAQKVDAQPASPARGGRVAPPPVGDVLQRLGAKLEGGASAKVLDEYSRHFDRTDPNRDGKHTREEYVERGAYMTPQARAGIFRAADGNADGVVTRSEYVLNRIITDEAKVIVQGMDDDEDGVVQRAEFVKHATKLCSDPELAERAFAALDANADGMIAIPEYLRVWGEWARIGHKSAEERIAARRAELAGEPAVTKRPKYNVLFIISDDLTYTALSCYGNTVCKTPNIDRLASRGVRFTRAYCQGTYCGPSRASFMSGYYPHATGVLGYKNPRPQIGDRATWSQHFMNNGYYTARVSKIFHMGVPGGIEKGDDGADDALSWTERFNSQGPEWKAPGDGETLESNPDGKKPVVGGNTFVVVEADGDDLVHSDGKTAAKAVELIEKHQDEPFWLGVGFVRPHVPFVAPKSYYTPFKPYDKMVLPERLEADWDDIPKPGINYKTSVNMKMDIRRQKKAIGGYYASVAYMDAQVGKVLDALQKAGLEDKTIVIFTSDHGYHLGEHDFWAKVSLLDESSGVPLIILVGRDVGFVPDDIQTVSFGDSRTCTGKRHLENA
jgi:Ca2+-binding EF-hand superfamily protein